MQRKERLKQIGTRIGTRVKQLRQSRDLSLNDLSRLSGVSKAALSQLESGSSNPRIDTLDSIAIALRLPLGDLLGGSNEQYPYLERHHELEDAYAQELLFRIGLGSVAEIWHLRMRPGTTIHSPSHTLGTYEHLFLHQGTLTLHLGGGKSETLHAGDFFAFAGDAPHSYLCGDAPVDATVVMSYSAMG